MKVALSGCFDCLHKGHKVLLKKAEVLSTYGNYRDTVTVALNSDESVRRLKGNSRPFQNFETRKKALENYLAKCSNFKIIGFTTEEELLNIYRNAIPFVIIHGNDIKDTSKITGIDEFNVLLIPRIKDKNNNIISTTSIIENKFL